MKRRSAFAAAFFFLFAAALSSAAAGDRTDLSNTLVYAGEDIDTVNPILNDHGELATIIFSGLMKYDAHGKPVPDLAAEYRYDADSLTHSFVLRQGVKWHDGTDFSAADVVFTYQVLTRDKTIASTFTSDYEDIADVSSPEPGVVAIRMARHNAAMPDRFTMGIIPRHLLEGRDINTAPFNQKPVGTGRYKLVEWDTAGGMIVLERNGDHYDKIPRIERIVYRTVAVESAKSLMLQSGEADLAWLNAKYAEQFRGRAGYRNFDFASADYRSVSCDFRGEFWQRNGDSIGVLNYAVDKDAIVRSVLYGRGAAAYSPIQRNPLGSDRAADIYSYNPEKFAEEMDRLGWKKGADGFYERNGDRFSFTVQVRDYEEERVDIARVVSRQLRDAGVDMRLALVTRFDWRAGYDGFLAGFAAEFDPDQVYKNYVSGASDNNTRYSNPDVDALLRAGRRTDDPAKRTAIYGEFEKAYARRPGHLLLVYLDGNYVGTDGLSGPDTRRVLGHHAVGVMWNIEEWTISR